MRKGTLQRWCQLDTFRVAVAEQETSLIDYTMRRTLQLQEKAIGVIEGILDDQEAPRSVRLRAAQTVLDTSMKLRELRDIEARLTALEVALLAK